MSGLPNFNLKKGLVTTQGVRNAEVRNLVAPNNLKMAIVPIGEPSRPELHTLILNPESISESKAANWVKQYIPGQSDPLLQWISGTERTITFMAKITLDIAENFTVNSGSNQEEWSLQIEPELIELSQITSTYDAKVLGRISANQEPTAEDSPLAWSDAEVEATYKWQQSIQPQLDFYRSLLVPRKSSIRGQNKTPPLVKLFMGNILGGTSVSRDQKFILASYQINITQTTPNLMPTSAEVTFTFIEYNDRSKTFTPVTNPRTERNTATRENAGPTNGLKYESKKRVLGTPGGDSGSIA